MREFDGKRLYKLTRRVVITVTIVSVFLSTISYYRIWKGDQDLRLCGQKYSYTSDAYIKCGESPALTMRIVEENVNTYTNVALIFPIVFFGGTWLYKYLFPLVHKKLHTD